MAKNTKKTVLIVTSLLIIGGAVGFLLWKRSKKKKEEEERKKAEEQALLDSQSNKPSGSGSGGSGYSAPASGNPFSDSASLKKFQQWVIDVKKDSAILGSAGADGKWGSSSANAWSKYGNEYSGVGVSSSQTTSNVIGKNAIANKDAYVYSTPSTQKLPSYTGEEDKLVYAIGMISSGNKLGKIKGIRQNEGITWYEVEVSIGLSTYNAKKMFISNYISNPKIGWVNSANITVQ